MVIISRLVQVKRKSVGAGPSRKRGQPLITVRVHQMQVHGWKVAFGWWLVLAVPAEPHSREQRGDARSWLSLCNAGWVRCAHTLCFSLVFGLGLKRASG